MSHVFRWHDVQAIVFAGCGASWHNPTSQRLSHMESAPLSLYCFEIYYSINIYTHTVYYRYTVNRIIIRAMFIALFVCLWCIMSNDFIWCRICWSLSKKRFNVWRFGACRKPEANDSPSLWTVDRVPCWKLSRLLETHWFPKVDTLLPQLCLIHGQIYVDDCFILFPCRDFWDGYTETLHTCHDGDHEMGQDWSVTTGLRECVFCHVLRAGCKLCPLGYQHAYLILGKNV